MSLKTILKRILPQFHDSVNLNCLHILRTVPPDICHIAEESLS